jgi:hypothetical protein
LDRARVGDLAYRNEIPLHELSVRSAAEDPVVAVLEACRRPPSVLPVQAPATVQVPEHAEAQVLMPFSGLGSGGGGGGGKRAAETDSAAESALLSVIEVPKSATEAVPTPEAAAESPEPKSNDTVATGQESVR